MAAIFKKQLAFVKYLTDNFDIGLGNNQIRVGVLSFSSWPSINIYLKESTDRESIQRKIEVIKHQQGDMTNTDAALNMLADTMFKPEYGGRKNAEHLAILLTDGVSYNPKATQAAAKRCHDANIKIIAIGIGDKINSEELRDIASEPKSRNFLFSADFTALNRIESDVIQRTCQEVITTASTTTTSTLASTTTASTTTPSTTTASTTTASTTTPSTTTASTTTTSTTATTKISLFTTSSALETTRSQIQSEQRECKNKVADIWFLLDSSSSITADNFGKQKNIIENMVGMLDIHALKTRVAISTFNHEYQSIVMFGDTNDKQEVIKKIEAIEYVGGGTKTGNALKKVRTELFSSGTWRPKADHIIIVFTDGRSSDYKETKAEAELLKKLNIKIFAVGIGSSVDQIELEDIASKPFNSFVHNFESFDVLLNEYGILTRIACNASTELLPADEDACQRTIPTDVMFMVGNNQFGSHRTQIIFEGIKAAMKKVNSGKKFRFGTVFEDCLPNQDVRVGITGEKEIIKKTTNFIHGDFTSLFRKLNFNNFLPNSNYFTRHFGMLFIDRTVNLNNPEITTEIQRILVDDMLLFYIVIGDGVNMSKIPGIAPKMIIKIPSYEALVTTFPVLLSDTICKAAESSGGRPDIS
ncbi:collagen alpha-5(VI) chain isoform X1 [Octopus sinensis]|uniref:Collagen alpha-5(VI) chain isoform X1 n=2 Tax=Octopus sinensis TaxID=2607531 RepID=A0A6P7SBW5_9MOLL|nr:collagen alpha-5(VI) chain isoform X1 [Octopus sinensis]